MNAVEIEQAISELALQPFDAAEFPYAFLAAFGNKEVTLKRLRSGNNNTSDLPSGGALGRMWGLRVFWGIQDGGRQRRWITRVLRGRHGAGFCGKVLFSSIWTS